MPAAPSADQATDLQIKVPRRDGRCPSWASVAVILNTDQNQFKGARVNLLLSTIEGSQGRSLEVGTEKETWEKCCPRGLLSLLSCMTQDHPNSSGTTHRRLGPPTPITEHENAPQTHQQADNHFLFSPSTPTNQTGLTM